MKTIDKILQERKEQIEKHGRTIKNDKENNKLGQLRIASILLVHSQEDVVDLNDVIYGAPPTGWDREIWQKMLSKPYQERLIISASLLLAEYDRVSK